jgi:RNA-binding protein
MREITATQRRDLRSRAHHLHPTVMIGDAGLTPPVLHEIDVALKSHELIKVRVLGDDRDLRGRLGMEICQALDAAEIQSIGKVIVLFRPRPEEPGQPGKSPPRRPRKPRFRAKRTFQNR